MHFQPLQAFVIVARQLSLSFLLGLSVMCSLIGGLGVPMVYADTYSWTGVTSTAWDLATNWSPSTAVPADNDLAVFDANPSNQPLIFLGNHNVGGFWSTTGSPGTLNIGTSSTAMTLSISGNQTVRAKSNIGIYMDDDRNTTMTLGYGNQFIQNSQTWYVGTGNRLTFKQSGSANYLNLNGKTLTIEGAGTVDLLRLNNLAGYKTGTIMVKGCTVKNTGGFSGSINQVQLHSGSFALSGNWLTTKVTDIAGFDFMGTATLVLGNDIAGTSYATSDLSSKIKIEDGATGMIDTYGQNPAAYASAFQVGSLKSGSFTKIGLGTLTLSGQNTYTGLTTMANGTLKLTASNVLSANSSVAFTGGKLDLNFTGTQTVDRLYINGVWMKAETYGSTLSPAQKQDDTYFSGTGVLLQRHPQPPKGTRIRFE